MKKYNFVLTPQNWKQFVHRFNKLINKTGTIVVKGTYTGRKPIETMLKKSGFVTYKHIGLVPVVNTIDCYFTTKSITAEWRVSQTGISMSRIGGTFLHIPFGIKMYITDSKIQYKTNGEGFINSIGLFHEILSTPLLEKANYQIQEDKEYEEDYWQQVDDDINRELKEEKKYTDFDDSEYHYDLDWEDTDF